MNDGSRLLFLKEVDEHCLELVRREATGETVNFDVTAGIYSFSLIININNN